MAIVSSRLKRSSPEPIRAVEMAANPCFCSGNCFAAPKSNASAGNVDE